MSLISQYMLESYFVKNLKHIDNWVPKSTFVESLPNTISARSRPFTNLFNAKQYKFLGIPAPFLYPFCVTYKKKIPYIIYRMNLKATDEMIRGTKLSNIIQENNLIPLLTSFSIWDHMLENTHRSDTELVNYFHFLFPQWSKMDWKYVVDQCNTIFRRTNNNNLIKAEMKRLQYTQNSHYMWWNDDDLIRIVHKEIDLKLKSSPPFTAHPNPNPSPTLMPLNLTEISSSNTVPFTSNENEVPKRDCVLPYAPFTSPLILYVGGTEFDRTATYYQIINQSKELYDFFKGQLALAVIQFEMQQNQLDVEKTKMKCTQMLQENSKIQETFPNQFDTIKKIFQENYLQVNNTQIFQLWQQSLGDMDIIQRVCHLMLQ